MSLKQIFAVTALSVGALLTNFVARPALAQNDSAAAHLAGLSGAVVDSLHGGVLKGAIIQVVGTGREGTSDSTGRYHIDSIPPGQHKVALFHPLLDTLGLSVVTNPLTFNEGKAAQLILGVPSPNTTKKLFCGKDTGMITGVPEDKDAKIISAKGNKAAVLLGRVVDADTDEPIIGADVTVTWKETAFGKKGLGPMPVTYTVKTDGSGAFHICGMPGPNQATLKAVNGPKATGEVPIMVAAGGLGLAQLNMGGDTAAAAAAAADSTKKANAPPAATIGANGAPQPIVNSPPATAVPSPPPATSPSTSPQANNTAGTPTPPVVTTPAVTTAATTTASAASATAADSNPPPAAPVVPLRTGHAQLTGQVTDPSGKGISGAFVSVQGAASHTVTSDSGKFTLNNLPSGTQSLLVKAVGFKAMTQAINLSSNTPAQAAVAMVAATVTLDTVHIKTPSQRALDRVGFTQRQKMGFGHFLNDSAVAARAMSANSVADLMWGIPGLRVGYNSQGNETLQSSRGSGGCVAYFVDGSPIVAPVQPPTSSSGTGSTGMGGMMSGGRSSSSHGGTSGGMSSPPPLLNSSASASTGGVDIEQYVQEQDIGAVEVYQPSEAPAQYKVSGKSSCITIVIWTKGYLGITS